MSAFLHALVALDPIAMVTAGGLAGIGALVFAESGILLGIFLPGDSLLFAAGLLAGGGVLSYWLLVSVVCIAAIFGDSVGYWFGYTVGERLYERPDSRLFKRAYLVKTHAFFEKYGARAVILARFVPIVRTIAPILAGVGRMPYGRFLSYNIIGGLLWGAGVVSAGFFLGTLIPGLTHYILPISLLIIVISFIPVLINILRGRSAV